MTRLPLQKPSSPEGTNEFSVPYGDFAAHGDGARTALEGPALEGAVIHVRHLRFRGDHAAIVRVEHDEIGVGAGLDRAFAWEEAEGLRDLRVGDVDEGGQVDLPGL